MATAAHRFKSASRKGKRARKRQPMTATEARTFNQFSMASALQILEARDARAEEGVHPNCACEPYEGPKNGWFTFDRWKAQGFIVQKGEHAVKISSWVPIRGKGSDESTAESDGGGQQDASDPEEGGSRPHLRPKVLHLFCRCQVAEKGE